MSITGEHSIESIGTSTPVTIGLLVSVVTAVFAAGGAWVRLSSLQERMVVVEARATPDAVWRQQVQDELESVKSSLQRLERKLGTARDGQ